MELTSLFLSFLGGSAIATLISVIFNRRKNKSEADLNTTEAAAKIVELYDKALKDLQAKVETLEMQVASLREQLAAKDIELAVLQARLRGGNGGTF